MNPEESNLDEHLFAIADALGPDVVELAPADEGHFDGASVALMVSSAVAGAVGSGVLAAVTQSAQEGTERLIQSAVATVRRLLSRKAIEPLFQEDVPPEQRDTALDAAAARYSAALQAIEHLDTTVRDQLAQASAAAIRDTLEELGLGEQAGERVRSEVYLQLTLSIHQS